MKVWSIAAILFLGGSLWGEEGKVLQSKCTIIYKGNYAYCQAAVESEPAITLTQVKKYSLAPYTAKGKVFVNPKKRQLTLVVGRAF